MVNNIEIRPTTREDIEVFFKGEVRDTCRAWSVFQDGELICISGVAITRTVMVAFSEIKPGLEYNKLTCWRTAKTLWGNIKGLNYPILYAVANSGLITAPAFLERLGFKHVESSVRGEIYRWAIQ